MIDYGEDETRSPMIPGNGGKMDEIAEAVRSRVIYINLSFLSTRCFFWLASSSCRMTFIYGSSLGPL